MQINDWKTPLSQRYRRFEDVTSFGCFVIHQDVEASDMCTPVLISTGRTCSSDLQPYLRPFFMGDDAQPFPQPLSLREASLWTPLKDTKLNSLLLSYQEYFS